jgi:hypothetical protein
LVAHHLRGLTAEALTLAVPLDADRPGGDVLPDSLRRAEGRSATSDHVHTERLLAASTARGGAPALATATADGFVSALAESGIELGIDQAAAVRGVLTSGAQVESLVGPAGTGKSLVRYVTGSRRCLRAQVAYGRSQQYSALAST